MTRKDKLKNLFQDIEEEQKIIIDQLIDEVVFLEERLNNLRKLPTIRVNKKNPAMQEITPAGKQYKEYMQTYINSIKVLQTTLYRAGETGESPLLKALKEFDIDE